MDRRRDLAKTDGERKEAIANYWKEMQTLIQQALNLAEEIPDDAVALDAIIWTTEIFNSGYYKDISPEVNKAYSLLTDRWIRSDRLAPVCYRVGIRSIIYPKALRFLEAAYEKSPHRVVRGVACLGLAQRYRRFAHPGRSMRDPITRKPLEQFYSAEVSLIKSLDTCDPDELDRRAEVLLERVIAEFGDVLMPPPSDPTPLGERARGELFRVRRLAIGRAVPEITGEDVQGKKLKSSDYRGKVVVLVFWATWCGPCMGMIPHERELVKRLKGKPFVLLGINGDEDKDRDKVKEIMEKEGMTWQSWWGGEHGGSIASTWGVSSWPTVYVIDAKGVIRYEYGRLSEVLDQAIDRLVKEVEQERRSN